MADAKDAGRAQFTTSIAESYDTYLGASFFAPFAVDLADRGAALTPARVLELAAGTGILTHELAARLPDARVLATDLNPGMLQLAEQRAGKLPNVRFKLADAQATDLPDGDFDLVVHQFGVMFFPDRPAHYREARRLLTPGRGHLLFSTYDTLEFNDCPRIAEETLLQVFAGDPLRFISRVPHGYCRQDAIAAELKSAGFGNVEFATVEQRCHAPSARHIAQGLCLGTPVRAEILKRDAQGMARAIDAVEQALAAQLGDQPLEGRMRAFAITAS